MRPVRGAGHASKPSKARNPNSARDRLPRDAGEGRVGTRKKLMLPPNRAATLREAGNNRAFGPTGRGREIMGFFVSSARVRRVSFGLASGLLVLTAASAPAATVPSGFTDSVLASGLSSP